jgi:hypothetical protein
MALKILHYFNAKITLMNYFFFWTRLALCKPNSNSACTLALFRGCSLARLLKLLRDPCSKSCSDYIISFRGRHVIVHCARDLVPKNEKRQKFPYVFTVRLVQFSGRLAKYRPCSKELIHWVIFHQWVHWKPIKIKRGNQQNLMMSSSRFIRWYTFVSFYNLARRSL